MNAAQKQRDKAARAVMHAKLSHRQHLHAMSHAMTHAMREALLKSSSAASPGTPLVRSLPPESYPMSTVSIVPITDIPMVVIPSDDTPRKPDNPDRTSDERDDDLNCMVVSCAHDHVDVPRGRHVELEEAAPQEVVASSLNSAATADAPMSATDDTRGWHEWFDV